MDLRLKAFKLINRTYYCEKLLMSVSHGCDILMAVL